MSEPAAILIPAGAGERLRLRPPSRSGEVPILVDPTNTGATRFAVGTQRLVPGGRIPVHRHHTQEEVLRIEAGAGWATLGDERERLETGATLYIPPGVWHGIENPGPAPLKLLWIISPPGLERMFRAIGTADGEVPAPLYDTEFAEIVREFEMETFDG